MFVGPKRWVFRREGRRLLAEETAIAARCDAAVFVSDEEAELFRERTGTDAARLHTVRNGVDTAYFDPGLRFDNPFADDDRAIVFVGAMDYWPNIDAVTWFADNVLPAVLTRNPRARFHIVGSNPGSDVRSLARRPGIVVSGRVDDVRPYLKYAACSVAPLRVARGVQNKVLEAMAMARPIVATPEAVNGIAANPEVVVRAEPADWAEAVSRFVAAEPSDLSVPASRERVASEYSWEAAARRLFDLTPAISH
jgi:sugar transferase (PEP-CTERM/EpsH1 system associated)